MKIDFAEIRKTTAWRVLGSAKFAIGILIFFAVMMIAGTLVESRAGTALAAQLVYGSLWFYLVQLLILISLVVAVLDRLPFRRKLIGFYTVHFSLVIIFIGSFITRAVGIDGDMRLSTNTASQTIRLPEELIYLKLNQREYQIPWPSLWTSLLGGGKGALVEDQGVRFSLVKVLPRAQSDIVWSSDLVPGAQSQWAGEWILKNERLSERLMLAFPGGNLVPNSTQMGPLEIKLVSWPQFQLETSLQADQLRLVFNQEDFLVVKSKLPQNLQTSSGVKFAVSYIQDKEMGIKYYEVKVENKKLRFFPTYSEFPVSNKLEADESSSLRMYEVSENASKAPRVLLSLSPDNQVPMAAFIEQGKWKRLPIQDQPIALPWMKFTLSPLRTRIGERPQLEFASTSLFDKSGEATKAALIRAENLATGVSKEFWLSNRTVQGFTWGNSQIEGFVGNKTLEIPFQIHLARFKIEHYPGTQDPSSFESIVNVLGNRVRISMNEPLKQSGYTFYQASYTQDDRGLPVSVLSVNKDPGRLLKYFGSLLLVIGLILHYLVIYKKIFI